MMQFTFSPASLAQHAHPSDEPLPSGASTTSWSNEGGQQFGEMLAESAQRHRGMLPQLGEEGAADVTQASAPASRVLPAWQAPGERVGQHIAGVLSAVQTVPQPEVSAVTEQTGSDSANEAALAAQLGQAQAAAAQAQGAQDARRSSSPDVMPEPHTEAWTGPIAALFEPEATQGQHAVTETHTPWDIDAPSTSTVASFSASTEDEAASSLGSLEGTQQSERLAAAAAVKRSQAEVDADELRSEQTRQNEADALAREQAEASFRAALWSAPYPGMLVAEHAAPVTATPVDASEQAWQSSLQSYDVAQAPTQRRAAADGRVPEAAAEQEAIKSTAALELRDEEDRSEAAQLQSSQASQRDSHAVTPQATDTGAASLQAAAQIAAPSANSEPTTDAAPAQPAGSLATDARNEAPQPITHGAAHPRQPVGMPRSHVPQAGGQAGEAEARRASADAAAAAPQHGSELNPAAAPSSVRSDNPSAAPGAAPSAAQATPELPRAIASEQLAQTLAQSAAQGVGNVRLRIMPEGLGELDVRVRVQRGQVRLQIEGEAPELAQLIGRNMHALREALGQHALTLDELQFNNPPAEQDARAGAEQSFTEFAERHGARDAQGEQLAREGTLGEQGREVAGGVAAALAPSVARAGTHVIDVTL